MKIEYDEQMQKRHDLGARAIGTLMALAEHGDLMPATKERIRKMVAEWESTFPQPEPKEAA